MQEYLEPVDDGLPMRESGPWVAEKLDYLKRYIDMFTISMHNKGWRALNYIDLFAGPGKCRVTSTGAICLGSPLLALKSPRPFTACFFVDTDPDAIAALRQRCRVLPCSTQVHFFDEDCNVVVERIVSEIAAGDHDHADEWPSLNLVFLDPEGLELRWDTMKTLARLRTDLIIHYPQQSLQRTLHRFSMRDDETLADTYFGSREWRDIYNRSLGRSTGVGIHWQLLDYYKTRLASLGYKDIRRDDETGYEPLIRNAQKNAPLYRLLCASKHELALKFWSEVTRRNVHGQRRMPL